MRVGSPRDVETLTTPVAGLARWESVRVEHCRDAWGLVVGACSGWSLVYSGDSRPCARLQRAGAGCTLLVHEATFAPSLAAQVFLTSVTWHVNDRAGFLTLLVPRRHACHIASCMWA